MQERPKDNVKSRSRSKDWSWSGARPTRLTSKGEVEIDGFVELTPSVAKRCGLGHLIKR